jgi:hypothetical protein
MIMQRLARPLRTMRAANRRSINSIVRNTEELEMALKKSLFWHRRNGDRRTLTWKDDATVVLHHPHLTDGLRRGLLSEHLFRSARRLSPTARDIGRANWKRSYIILLLRALARRPASTPGGAGVCRGRGPRCCRRRDEPRTSTPVRRR